VYSIVCINIKYKLQPTISLSLLLLLKPLHDLVLQYRLQGM
jgi:hypothetical protein